MYLTPSVPVRTYPRKTRRHLANLNFLGLGPAASLDAVADIERTLPGIALRVPQTSGPGKQITGPGSAPSTTTTSQNPSGAPAQGMCTVTSSPETGSITSIVPCANVGPNAGGTVAPVDTALLSVPTTPVPSNYPTSQPFYASDGSVWNWNSQSAEWQETQAPGSVFLPGGNSALSPVPSGWPTSEPFDAPDGSVWVYSSIFGWQETQAPGSSLPSGSDVPNFTPTGLSRLIPYKSPDGSVWQFENGTWVEIKGPTNSAFGSNAVSPVPVGYPTTQPFYANDGSVWAYNATAGQWMETSSPAGSGYVLPGSSPVPSGYPITQPYYAADGSVWNYNPTTATWVETQLPGTAAAALVAQNAGVSPGGSNVSITSPPMISDYQSVLDWFSQESVISGVKNIWLVAGAAAVFLFFKSRGRR